MPFRESAEAVSVDQAWSDLRHHLDWTRGGHTVVFLAAQSHDQVDDLRERTVLWCRRNRERWTLCESDAGSVDWLRRELPRSGVLWLDLWEEPEVGRARSLLPADPVGARRVLDDSRISDSPIRRIVFGLTRAEIAGLLGGRSVLQGVDEYTP